VPRSVLFVDDSPLAAALYVRRFQEKGLAVVSASSFRGATELTLATVGAAVLDIDLGDGWGPDLAVLLRQRAPTLPIAFITAGGAPAMTDRAKALGRVFDKPADIERTLFWVLSSLAAEDAPVSSVRSGPRSSR
jgi:DNA-binding response OmpR family regulator